MSEQSTEKIAEIAARIKLLMARSISAEEIRRQLTDAADCAEADGDDINVKFTVNARATARGDGTIDFETAFEAARNLKYCGEKFGETFDLRQEEMDFGKDGE